MAAGGSDGARERSSPSKPSDTRPFAYRGSFSHPRPLYVGAASSFCGKRCPLRVYSAAATEFVLRDRRLDTRATSRCDTYSVVTPFSAIAANIAGRVKISLRVDGRICIRGECVYTNVTGFFCCQLYTANGLYSGTLIRLTEFPAGFANRATPTGVCNSVARSRAASRAVRATRRRGCLIARLIRAGGPRLSEGLARRLRLPFALAKSPVSTSAHLHKALHRLMEMQERAAKQRKRRCPPLICHLSFA